MNRISDTQELNSGEFISLGIIKILSIPSLSMLNRKFTNDEDANEYLQKEWNGLLSEIYQIYKSGMQDKQLTWHECADRKTVRAIPTRINAAFKHTGGIGTEKVVQAMRSVLTQQYGENGLELQREGITGTVDGTDLQDAIRQTKEIYRAEKTSLFSKN